MSINLTGDVIAPVLFAVLLTAWMWIQNKEYDSTYSIAILFSVGALLAYLVSGSLLFVPVFAVAYVFEHAISGAVPMAGARLVDVTHGGVAYIDSNRNLHDALISDVRKD